MAIHRHIFTLVSILSLVTAHVVVHSDNTPRKIDHGVNLDSHAPLIIAHRGASGILPEHTVAGYMSAIDQGADVIECDVMVTKDKRLVCLHDSGLKHVTNVANGTLYPEFADRKTAYNISNYWFDELQYNTYADDWFTVDFTLAELKRLTKVQNNAARDPNYDGLHQIATLEELLKLVQVAGRRIGVHLETKTPRWINSQPFMQGTSVEELLVELLNRYGYKNKTNPCFLQSFEEDSLYRLKPLTDLPLVRLIYIPQLNTSDARLKEWAKSFYGIGPWKEAIVPFWNSENGYKNKLGEPTDLVERAHKHGLYVHTYTFRNEDQYLAWDFHQDPVKEYELYINMGVDGLFTDFPGTLKRYMDMRYKDDTCGAAFLAVPIKLSLIIFVLEYMLLQ